MSAPAAVHDLSGFTGEGYDYGRGRGWRVAWFVTQNLAFAKWWMPGRFRPSILRAFGAKVGDGVVIRENVRVHWPWKLEIGDHTWIGVGAYLLNLEPIVIGHDVCISQQSFICTGSHKMDSPTFEFDNAAILVDDGSWIAARAIVLRGVTVGRGAVVAANSVAARDVPAADVVLQRQP